MLHKWSQLSLYGKVCRIFFFMLCILMAVAAIALLGLAFYTGPLKTLGAIGFLVFLWMAISGAFKYC
jgi:hypothetical protein